MAYVEPPIRANGDLITAGIWNQDLVANEIAIKALADNAPIPYPGTAATNTSTAKTVWFTHPLPIMGANDKAFVELSYTFLNNAASGNESLTLTIEIGASTAITVVLHNLVSSASPYNGRVSFAVSALNSTSSQRTQVWASYARSLLSTTTMTTPTTGYAHNDSGEDLTISKSLVVSGTLSLSNALLEMEFLGASVTQIS